MNFCRLILFWKLKFGVRFGSLSEKSENIVFVKVSNLIFNGQSYFCSSPFNVFLIIPLI